MSYDSNNSNYPPSVVPSSVFVDVIFDGKMGKPSEMKVTGVGVGKRVYWKDVEAVSNTLKTQMHRYSLGNSYVPVPLSAAWCPEIGISNVGMTNPGEGSLQKNVDSGGEALFDDTAVVSRGILGFKDVGLCLSDEEGECVRLVKTGGNEGTAVVGDNEGSGDGTTDGRESIRSTTGQGGVTSCL